MGLALLLLSCTGSMVQVSQRGLRKVMASKEIQICQQRWRTIAEMVVPSHMGGAAANLLA